MIYTKYPGQLHVKAVRWVLDQLQKHSLFANLKKCRFHQDEVRFLGYIVSSKRKSIEAERIEVVKDWPEPKSVRNIQVFLNFANFYRRFIQSFSKKSTPLTSMLKTTGLLDRLASSRNDGSKPVSSRNDSSKPASGKNDGNGEFNEFGVDGVEHVRKSRKLNKSSKLGNSKSEKTSKSRKLAKSKKNLSKSGNLPNFDAKNNGLSFLIPKARAAFNRLRLAFTKALILRHFDPKCHIKIETDTSGYIIGCVLSQLAFGISSNGVVINVDLG